MKKAIYAAILLMLTMVSVAYAADTIAIASDDWISLNDNISVSATFDDEAKNATGFNMTISDGTNTYTLTINTTTADFGYNATTLLVPLNMTGLNDSKGADGYTITATYINSSGFVLGTDTELVGIDNTVPICSFSGIASSTTYTEGIIANVTKTNASSATIKFGLNPTYSMTDNPPVFTFDTTNTPPATYSTVTAITSDGYNTTTCTLTQVTLQHSGSSSGYTVTTTPEKAAELTGGQSPTAFIFFLIVAVLAIVVAVQMKNN